MTRPPLVTLAAAAVLSFPAGARAAAPCPPLSYPGDNAQPADIADWMARGALAVSLPGDLPVMAALVESDLHNLTYGDADSVGYFQMRTSIWDQGAYAGYPANPELQLRWFTDQATTVESRRVGAGQPARGPDETQWGEWIADVERPAAQYRGRYQPRLADARALIGDPCVGGGGVLVPDVTPPETARVMGPKATTTATTLRFRFRSPDATATFRCKLDRGAYKTCRSPLVLHRLRPGSHTLRVQAVDAAGNADATPVLFRFRIVRA